MLQGIQYTHGVGRQSYQQDVGEKYPGQPDGHLQLIRVAGEAGGDQPDDNARDVYMS